MKPVETYAKMNRTIERNGTKNRLARIQICVRTGQGFEMVRGTIGWMGSSVDYSNVRCDTARILKYHNEIDENTCRDMVRQGARAIKIFEIQRKIEIQCPWVYVVHSP